MKKMSFSEHMAWTFVFCLICILVDLFLKKRKEEETE